MNLKESPNNLLIRKAVFWGIFGLIIVGIYLQTEGIGKDSFFIDELYHVYAAKSLNENHTLSLPSGKLYARASIYTYLVSLSFKIFGISEFSARLPSVVCGLLYLSFYYYIITKLFNSKIAILSTFMLMFSYMQIHFTKDCRMYSIMQFSYLGMVYFFYKIISGWMPEAGIFKFGSTRFFSFANLLFMVSFSLTAWISYKLHLLSLLFFPSALIFLSLVGIESICKKKYSNRIRLVLIVYGLFAGLAIAMYLLRRPLSDLYEHYLFLPEWSKERADHFLFYIGVLKHETLLLWLLIPIGAGISIYRFGRPAICILSFFAIPFLILSALPLKAPRYIYHIYPLTFIFIAVTTLTLNRKVVAKIYSYGFRRKELMEGLWMLSIVLFIGFNIANSHSESKMNLPVKPDWKQVAFVMREKLKSDDIVVSDNPIATKFYLGRVDYVIDENLLQISQLSANRSLNGSWLDLYTNAVHITNVEDLDNVSAGNNKVLIFLGHRGRGFEEIIQYIRKTYRPIDENISDKRINVYQKK